MNDVPRPKARSLKVWLPVAGAICLAVAAVAVLMWPRPKPAPVAIRPPEWRCTDQAKGGPICERPLPPAARPTPR